FRYGLCDDVQDLLLTLADPSSFSEAITQAIRSRETSPKDKQPVSLLWQPRAHSSPVPSKACQTSSTS
ncbi:unnamed protein product, partial [Sphagnum balticum]